MAELCVAVALPTTVMASGIVVGMGGGGVVCSDCPRRSVVAECLFSAVARASGVVIVGPAFISRLGRGHRVIGNVGWLVVLAN